MSVTRQLMPEAAQFLATVFPAYKRSLGTNFPLSVLAYDAATDEAAFFKVDVTGYTSGNLTLDIVWAADSATTGNVVWEAAIAAVTPETDTGSTLAKAFATALTVTDGHLGTSASRLMRATITISNLDSLAAGDTVWVRIRRTGSSGSDTMAGDAFLVHALLTYPS